MKHYQVRRSQFLSRPRSEVFGFFEDPFNLARITPPFLDFEILTPPPITMQTGTRIEYRIKLFGVPLRWRTEIEEYEPGARFVDRQTSGPYRHWRHTHVFRDVAGGTEMSDEVDYAIGVGVIGSVANAMFVRKTLERIFDYRAAIVADLFGGVGAGRTPSRPFTTADDLG